MMAMVVLVILSDDSSRNVSKSFLSDQMNDFGDCHHHNNFTTNLVNVMVMNVMMAVLLMHVWIVNDDNDDESGCSGGAFSSTIICPILTFLKSSGHDSKYQATITFRISSWINHVY